MKIVKSGPKEKKKRKELSRTSAWFSSDRCNTEFDGKMYASVSSCLHWS